MAFVNKRSLTVSIGGTEYASSISSAKLVSGETQSDFVPFADAAAGGGREYKFQGTAAQDHATGSIWTSPGSTVACVYRPYGNALATATQPHYTFNAVVSEPDGDFLGGDADASVTAVQTFDFEWTLTAKPTQVVA